MEISTFAWGLFMIAMIFFVGASLVLLYHWRTYGISSRQIVSAEIVYLSVSIVLIGFSLVSLNFI